MRDLLITEVQHPNGLVKAFKVTGGWKVIAKCSDGIGWSSLAVDHVLIPDAPGRDPYAAAKELVGVYGDERGRAAGELRRLRDLEQAPRLTMRAARETYGTVHPSEKPISGGVEQ